jgi:hypothetical protein
MRSPFGLRGCMSVYLSVPPSAAKQRGFLLDEKRVRPFIVGALTEQSSGPSPPPPSQTKTNYCQVKDNLILLPTVSRPVYLGVKHSSEAHD